MLAKVAPILALDSQCGATQSGVATVQTSTEIQNEYRCSHRLEQLFQRD